MARRALHPRLKKMPSKDADDETRIRWLKQDYWLGYETSVHIRDALKDLLDYPEVTRMPNLSIIGKPHSGKTALLKKFVDENSPKKKPKATSTDLPILMIDAPPSASENRFYRALLSKLGMSGPANERVEAKQERLLLLLEDLNVRMIIVDEFNRSLKGGGTGLGGLMSAIRDIGNKLKITFVLAGTEEVHSLLATDQQQASRFPPMFTRRWGDDLETRRLLKSITELLPLRGTVNLIADKAVNNLLTFSEGILGEMIDIVRKLAIDAIKGPPVSTGLAPETIGFANITKSNLRRLGYVSPSVRAFSEAEQPT